MVEACRSKHIGLNPTGSNGHGSVLFRLSANRNMGMVMGMIGDTIATMVTNKRPRATAEGLDVKI